jgi:hypothetical protein
MRARFIDRSHAARGNIEPSARQGQKSMSGTLGAGSSSDLLFGAAPAVGFRLADVTTLSDGTVILGYETDKALARETA